MAAFPYIKFIAAGGYGIIYGNFSQNETEPNVITKFFNAQQGYLDEKKVHNALFTIYIKGTREAPTYPRLKNIIGIGSPDTVRNIQIRGVHYPEYNRGCIHDGGYNYPVVKMPYLGKNLWGNGQGGSGEGHRGLTLNTFMNIFETFIFFHTTAVHGDMKMDNILWDGASGKAAIIDLGLTNQFIKGRVPWFVRDRDDPYFPWPPEYWTSTQRDYYSKGAYINRFNKNAYVPTGAEHFWLDIRNTRAMLATVYDDYLSGDINDAKCLTMGVTADLYGIGKTLYNSIRNIPQEERDATYLVGYAQNGVELRFRYADIIKTLGLLFINIHPKLRPLDYTVVRYLRVLNKIFMPTDANKTIINVNGTPYFEIKFLNKAYATINIDGQHDINAVNNGKRIVMAYGHRGSPITREQMQENMKIFAFLMTKPYLDLKRYFNTADAAGVYTNLKYNKVLQEAVNYFKSLPLQGIQNLADLDIVPPLPQAAPPGPGPRVNPVQAGHEPFAQAHFGGGGDATRQAAANARGAAAAAAQRAREEAQYVAARKAEAAAKAQTKENKQAAANARTAAAGAKHAAEQAAAAAAAAAPRAPANRPLTNAEIADYKRKGTILYRWADKTIHLHEQDEGQHARNAAAYVAQQEAEYVAGQAARAAAAAASAPGDAENDAFQRRYMNGIDKYRQLQDMIGLKEQQNAELRELERQGARNQITADKRGQLRAELGQIDADIKRLRNIIIGEQIERLGARLQALEEMPAPAQRNAKEQLAEEKGALRGEILGLQQELAALQQGGFRNSGPLMNLIRNNKNLHSTISHKSIRTKRIYSEKKLLNSLKSQLSLEPKTEGNFLETFTQYYIKNLINNSNRINGTVRNTRNLINSGKTMKNHAIKLNTAIPKISQGSMYSEYQYDLIENQLAISEASGRLNTLYQYYLRALPNNKHIFSQLLKIPLGEEESLRISKYLQAGNVTELESYLSKHTEDTTIKSEKERVFNELGIKLVVEYYFAFQDDAERYMFLHTLFSSIPDTQKEIQELAQKFIKTKPGSNPFA